MLRTLRGNGPYGCEFDSMGLLCLKWNVLHVFTVLRMISEAELQVLADYKRNLTGGRTSKGGGRTRGQFGDQGNGRIDGQGGQIHTRSQKAAVGMSWEDFKNLTKEEFCTVNEMHKLENEFWNHAMVGAGHAAYTDRFHELARLVPDLVTLENKRIER
ncbi:hypothetical protein Tco_0013101 [Tanacetum coccineum]